jgi:hypothetical protein
MDSQNNLSDAALIAELTWALRAAQDHLRQYAQYSEAMRGIGRGLHVSSPYTPEFLDLAIQTRLDIAKAR